MRIGGNAGEKLAGKRINAREFIEDFRSGFTDLDLMLKYDLDEDDLQVLFKKVLSANILSEDDLKKRRAFTSRAPGSSHADAPNPAPAKLSVREPASAKRAPDGTVRPGLTRESHGSRGGGKTQVCPSCSKEIPSGAVRCNHCQTWLDGRDLGLGPDIASTGDRSHALKVIAKGIAGMLIGFMMQVFGGKIGLFLGTLVLLGCTGYYVWGCCVYVGTKGYHLAVGLLGLVPCFVGLLILVLMPER